MKKIIVYLFIQQPSIREFNEEEICWMVSKSRIKEWIRNRKKESKILTWNTNRKWKKWVKH
jgi:hypothetical protein